MFLIANNPSGIIAIAMIALFFIIAVRLAKGSGDHDRVRSYIENHGGKIVSIHWAPFGKGWFGEKNDRIYEVVYYDAEGRQHFATAKTSWGSGVFLNEDRVSHPRADWFEESANQRKSDRPMIEFLDRPKEKTPAEAELFDRLPRSISDLDREIKKLEQRLAQLKLERARHD